MLKNRFFHCLLISADYNKLCFSLFPRVAPGEGTEKKKKENEIFFLFKLPSDGSKKLFTQKFSQNQGKII